MDLLSIPGDASSIDYSEKKILVVDDYPNMQQSMRLVLNSFGISKIVMAGSASDAISKVRAQVFDGILCDYNLGGEEKDGQQLFEEMRFRSYIPLSTVFIMVTAETSYEKVIAAAEYVPDDYIIKPFNLNILKNRLSTGFAKKTMFARIYEQTAKGHHLNAAAICDEIAAKFPRYRIDALRLKGELLLTMKKADEAESLYDEIASTHAIPWARLWLVQSYHMQGKNDLAEELLTDIIMKNPEMVKSYDLLATIQESQWKILEMQKTLQSGVKISPKSLTRQRRLGDVAFKNNDVATAEKAYERIVEERHSYHFQPIDMATLSRSYIGRGDVNATRRLMDNQRKFLNATDVGRVIVSANMAEVCSRSGDIANAKRHLQNVLYEKDKGVRIDPAILVDVVGTCLKVSMEQVAATLWQEIVSNSSYGSEQLERLQKTYAEAGVAIPDFAMPAGMPIRLSEPIRKPDESPLPVPAKPQAEKIEKTVLGLGKDAIRLFKEGDLLGAYEKFHEAMTMSPHGQREIINYVIIVLRILENKGKDVPLILKWRSALEKAKAINIENPQLQKVIMEWEKIETRLGTQGKKNP